MPQPRPRPGVLGGNACVAGLAEPPWRSAEDVASVGADDGGVPAASAQDRARVGSVPGRSPGTQKLGGGVRECGWRQMTRVACDVGQPRRMETCGAEEPYEGNLHVRFCGGIGRVIADPTRTCSGRKGLNLAGESPVVSIARFRHVAIPQFVMGNHTGIAWRKLPGCSEDFALLREEQPGGLASGGA